MSKKSFKDNPALQFMSNRADAAAFENPPAVQPRSITPRQETKSKRFNMLLRPSLFQVLQESAGRQGISINELIHGILEEHVKNDKK